jgi:hypothetical protein
MHCDDIPLLQCFAWEIAKVESDDYLRPAFLEEQGGGGNRTRERIPALAPLVIPLKYRVYDVN